MEVSYKICASPIIPASGAFAAHGCGSRAAERHEAARDHRLDSFILKKSIANPGPILC
jgi:hypothetical protein